MLSARSAYSMEVPSMSNPPTRMVTSMSMGGGGGAPGQAPPDLPSLLLNSRICYLGMPVRRKHSSACSSSSTALATSSSFVAQ